MSSFVITLKRSLSTLFVIIIAANNLGAPPDNNKKSIDDSEHLLRKCEFYLGTNEGSGQVRSTAFSPDGRFVAATFADGKARVWKIAASERLKSEELAQLALPRKMIRVIAASPDGKSMVTGNDDCTVRFWQLAARCKELYRFEHEQAKIDFLSYCQDGRILATSGSDGTIRIYHADNREKIRAIPLGRFNYALAGSPRNAEIAVATSTAIIILDASDGRERGRIKCDPESVHALGYSQDGRMLAAVKQHSIEIYESASNKLVKDLLISRINALSFSKENRLLIAGTLEGALLICDLATGAVKSERLRNCIAISGLSYLSNGELMVFGNTDSSNVAWKIDGVRSDSIARQDGGIWSHPNMFTSKFQRLPRNLSLEDCQRLWDYLHKKDAEMGYWSIWNLVARPKQAVPYLDRSLRPVASLDRKYVIQLVNDLDSDAFQVRERASETLKQIGDLAIPILRARLQEKKSPELSRRIKDILYNCYLFNPDQLRILRAIQVLEYIASPDAILVLERLAKGASESRITHEAKFSIRYLKRK